MTANLEQFQTELMSLPVGDRRDVLLATLESSGVEFAGDFLNAVESARRAEELESGAVSAWTREEAFAHTRKGNGTRSFTSLLPS
jgi:hypothetical protein